MGLFVYIGGTYLFDNIITGTSTAEVIITNVVPIALACAVLFVVVKLFTG